MTHEPNAIPLLSGSLGGDGRRRQTGRFLLPFAGVMALFTVIQGFLDSSQTNIYCSVLVATATTIVIFYCFRPGLLSSYPISTIAVFGFSVTNYSLAFIAQTLDAKPLIFNLLSPSATFNATIEFQSVILAAHMFYTYWRPLPAASNWLSRRVLLPLWFFRTPQSAELWLLGSLGLVATWVSRILYVGDVDYGNVGGKFLQALVPFIVAPFFIPIRDAFFDQPRRPQPKIAVPALIGYFLVVVVTAVAFNARAIFAVVLFTVILSYVLIMSMGRLTLGRRTYTFLFVGVLVFAPLATGAQNLATAMQIARGLRGTAGTGEIMAETWRALQSPDELEEWRKKEQAKTAEGGFSGYSEIYLRSEFLQRLTYTKYTDLTMTASLQLTDWQRQSIRALAQTQIISILPTPLIKAIGFDVDKSDLNFSTGDVYADYAFNQEPGGERTGSSITNTFDVLGPLWAPIVFVIMVVTFMLLESTVLRFEGRVIMSTLAFIQLYETFARSLTYDSFRNLIDGITRAYIQSLFVFMILALLARMAVTILNSIFSRSASQQGFVR